MRASANSTAVMLRFFMPMYINNRFINILINELNSYEQR